MAGNFIPQLIQEPVDELGGASGAKYRFQILFQAKNDTAAYPFTVANEVVAATVGQALGLHVPSVLTYLIDGTPFVFSHLIDRRSDMAKPTPPPATSAALAAWVRANPQQVHGAVMFDLFLANNDRAFRPDRRNLFLDAQDQLVLYDNANGCFYRNRPHAAIEAGIPRLDVVEADLGAMFDMRHKKNTYFELLDDWKWIDFWFDRISQLPDFLLEHAVSRIPSHLQRPTAAERDRLLAFLIARKGYMVDHITNGRARWFPKLPARGNHA